MHRITHNSSKEGDSMRYIEGIHRKSKIALPEYVDDYVTEDNTVRIITTQALE